MENVKNSLACPKLEELSELVDGETDLSQVSQHVAKCENCQSVVSLYRRIDSATRSDMTPPADLADKIKLACKNAAPPESAPVMTWWSRPLVRYAAGFLLTALLAALAMAMMRGRDLEPMVADKPVENELDKTDVVFVKPGSTQTALTPALADNTVVRNAEMRVVNTQGGGGGNGTTLSTLHRLTLLPAEVRHVWVVDDLKAAEQSFLDILPEGTPRSIRQLDASRTAISVSLEDKQLQKLVDGLSLRKWDLVAPALPQPSKGEKVRFAGRTVHYVVQIVRKYPEK